MSAVGRANERIALDRDHHRARSSDRHEAGAHAEGQGVGGDERDVRARDQHQQRRRADEGAGDIRGEGPGNVSACDAFARSGEFAVPGRAGSCTKVAVETATSVLTAGAGSITSSCGCL